MGIAMNKIELRHRNAMAASKAARLEKLEKAALAVIEAHDAGKLNPAVGGSVRIEDLRKALKGDS